MLDDFCNLGIEDIDTVLSVSRSREVWITVICQSLTQLKGLYGDNGAYSVIGNCDAQLLLAAQDYETASYFSVYADKAPTTLLRTPIDRCWVFVRGQGGREAPKYDLADHPRYREMLDACAQANHPR